MGSDCWKGKYWQALRQPWGFESVDLSGPLCSSHERSWFDEFLISNPALRVPHRMDRISMNDLPKNRIAEP